MKLEETDTYKWLKENEERSPYIWISLEEQTRGPKTLTIFPKKESQYFRKYMVFLKCKKFFAAKTSGGNKSSFVSAVFSLMAENPRIKEKDIIEKIASSGDFWISYAGEISENAEGLARSEGAIRTIIKQRVIGNRKNIIKNGWVNRLKSSGYLLIACLRNEPELAELYFKK